MKLECVYILPKFCYYLGDTLKGAASASYYLKTVGDSKIDRAGRVRVDSDRMRCVFFAANNRIENYACVKSHGTRALNRMRFYARDLNGPTE